MKEYLVTFFEEASQQDRVRRLTETQLVSFKNEIKKMEEVVSISELLHALESHEDYREISQETCDWAKTDLRYASENNVLKRNFFKEFNRAFLHKAAFERLENAATKLTSTHPELKFLIFDALRPKRFQIELFDPLFQKPEQKYIANPVRGSIHSYGFAIDLSLYDLNTNKECDLGTEFDAFLELAEPKHEKRFCDSGKLTKSAFEKRLLLRQILSDSGFIYNDEEWWHFDAKPGKEVREKYTYWV